jgi:hypothetical protein
MTRKHVLGTLFLLSLWATPLTIEVISGGHPRHPAKSERPARAVYSVYSVSPFTP